MTVQMRKKNKINFNEIVKSRKLPILPLDTRWHSIFPEDEKTSEIGSLERKVNDLMMKQGKLVNELKDLKKLKSKVINDIVENMDIDSSKAGQAKGRKQDRNKQYIIDINDKIARETEELDLIPYEIKNANEALLAESMAICYNRIEKQKEQIEEISQWIEKTRAELTEKILMKQDMEAVNDKMYSYLHDLLGPNIMEAFDGHTLDE
ncbi:MAG: hypothetical protein GX915_06145 [Clostridiales bacterium]|nr:hypothetical protein [Clostridiales bacterium]